MRRGPDIGEIVTFVFIAAICGAVVYGSVLTLHRGAGIAGLGRAEKTVPVANTPAPVQPEPSPVRQERMPREVPARPADLPGAASSGGATMYKWVDEKGRICYSDKPHSARAERLEVAAVSTRNFPEAQSGSPKPITRVAAASQPVIAIPSSRPTGADYRFSVLNGFQISRNEVKLSGRVEGPACKRLEISVTAKSQLGRTVSASTVVNDIGVGSKLFEASTWATYPQQMAPPRWQVTGIQAYCTAH